MPPEGSSTDIEAALTRIEGAKLRWMAGGEAPTGGALDAGHTGVEAQLRLLAEAAQARAVCLRPDVPQTLETVAPVPTPKLPLLPEALRPMFRRLMKVSNERAHARAVIGLMARRGVMAHPFDWLPPKDTEGFPADYGALAAWQAGSAPRDEGEILSEANWDGYLPAERLAAFTAFRGSDPAAARALLATKAPAVPAEERTKLVAALAEGLSPEDQPFLESLGSDRSGKVKTAARRLLARLGVLAPDEDAAELAAFFEVKKGLLSRTPGIVPRTKLNDVQLSRIRDLLEIVPPQLLAGSLGTDEAGLAAMWSLKHQVLAEMMLSALVSGGGDAALRAFWVRMRAENDHALVNLVSVAPRLSPDEADSELIRIARAGPLVYYQHVTTIAGAGFSPAFAETLLKNATITEIIRDAAAAVTARDETHATRTAPVIAAEMIRNLGPHLPRPAAIALREKVQGPIFASADPALDPLNFNIALEGPAR